MAFCTYPKNSGSINKQGVDDVIGNAVGSPSQIGVYILNLIVADTKQTAPTGGQPQIAGPIFHKILYPINRKSQITCGTSAVRHYIIGITVESYREPEQAVVGLCPELTFAVSIIFCKSSCVYGDGRTGAKAGCFGQINVEKTYLYPEDQRSCSVLKNG